MTLHYYDVNSFKWVEKWYKRIRPVNERDHGTERNIRPMDARYRKWERLHKFSDNCYGIFDGSWGDPYSWRVHYHSEQEGFNAEMLTVAEIKKLCPILWTRHRDGTETIKIRNGTGRGKHHARYSLLERYLPYKLQLRKENGMQYIRNLDQGTTHYLAKSRTVPAYEFTIKDKLGGNTWFEREKIHTTG